MSLLVRSSRSLSQRLSSPLILSRALSTAPAPTLHPSESGLRPPHLLTLADLKVDQIQNLISSAIAFKRHYKAQEIPVAGKSAEGVNPKALEKGDASAKVALKSLDNKTVALMFSKRSTRTRVASETAVHLLGEFLSCFLRSRGAGADGAAVPQADTRCSLVQPTSSLASTRACTTRLAS